MVNGILLGVIFFILFFIVHILIFRFCHVKRKFRTIAVTAVMCLAAYTVSFSVLVASKTQVMSIEGSAAHFLNAANAFFLLFAGWYIYLYFIVFVHRSITARFMVEIEWSPEKKLQPDLLRKNFSFEEKLQTEINDMVKIKRIYKEGDRYFNTKEGIRHGKIIYMLKGLLRLDEKR